MDKAWQSPPYDTIYQAFLLSQRWWHNAVTGVSGVTRQHENTVAFATRQILDIFSPSNFLLTNPEVLERTQKEGGMNLVRGFQNFLEDWERTMGGHRPAGVAPLQGRAKLSGHAGKESFTGID